jgi:hypothetical protein
VTCDEGMIGDHRRSFGSSGMTIQTRLAISSSAPRVIE